MCILLDEALDQWLALTGREESYKIQPQPSAERQDEQKRKRDDPLSTHDTSVHSCPPMWREKICEWCFQVVDHCDIDRDVVSTALSYFDRYLSCHTSVAENMFQLVAMTSLYLAVKLHSTRKISVYSISSLSKGHFRVDQILKCEICIIKSLRWHLNPPTPSIYLNVASPLIDASGNAHTSCEISELARYLLELSVCDGFFSDKKQSSIAYAAIIVAMENLSISKTVRGRFASFELDKSPHATDICARRLRHVYSIALSTQPEEEQRAGSSPTSVAQG